MTAARKAGCCGDATGCWAALLSRQSEKCAACLGLMKTNGSRYWHTSVSAGKGFLSGEMQLCQPEYPEPLGKISCRGSGSPVRSRRSCCKP
ncbi:MAG: hypothetical protein ACLT3Y_04995 [Ruminococcus callidus]